MLKRLLAPVLLAFALLCAGASFTPALAQTVALPEAKNYVKDGSPYLVYGQFLQCSAAPEKVGPDCGGRIYVDPAGFPNNMVIAWATPLRATPTTKPWGYPAVSRGRPSGGVPKVLDPIKRLGDVKALPIAWNVDFRVVGDASLLSDTFLYADDALKTRVLELGVFGFAGPAARAFATGPLSQPIRTGELVTPDGRTWLARKSGAYLMYLPKTGDALTFDGDLKWFFDHAMGGGLATADMRYPGTALGVEPGQGAGMARIVSFSAPAP